MAPRTLPDRGVLWTWTLQAFEPKPPYVGPAGGFEPYPVGYVDLGDVIVESVLDSDPASLSVGMPMRLVAHEVRTTPEHIAIGYAFAPEREA